MQSGVEGVFHNMDRSPAVEARVPKHVERLERRFGHLTSFRATIDAPHRHLRKGKHNPVRLEVHDALERVRASILLVVGGAAHTVRDLDRAALDRLASPKRLEIVPGATHLCEDPGALVAVIGLAGDWFAINLREAGS